MRIVAILIGTGGSKRISKKNIKEFCVKSIVAHSIEVALQSNILD